MIGICDHEYCEPYETMFDGIYGVKCNKCGFVYYSKEKDVNPCECRFENEYSNTVIVCDGCSKYHEQ